MRKGRDVLRMETTHCRDGWQPNGRQGGTLPRTWRSALNAGIRAEGADDKLAHALRPNRLASFAQADLGPLHESTAT